MYLYSDVIIPLITCNLNFVDSELVFQIQCRYITWLIEDNIFTSSNYYNIIQLWIAMNNRWIIIGHKRLAW